MSQPPLPPESALSLDSNPYQAPTAPVLDTSLETDATFYVVGLRKFLVMMIGTLGLYGFYWFYKNWALFNRRYDTKYWPVPRAIFSIFFTHSLFNEVDGQLQKRGVAYDWMPGLAATVYVVAAIAGRILDRLAVKEIGSPVTDVLGIVMMVPMVWALYRGQRAINLAEGDPEGTRNARLTTANILWLLPCLLLWLLVLLGLAAIALGLPTE
jgi:hypothetical protein